MNSSKPRAFLAIMMLVVWSQAHAVPVDTGFIEWTQPDGMTFIGRAWGDEFAMDFETVDGYSLCTAGIRHSRRTTL